MMYRTSHYGPSGNNPFQSLFAVVMIVLFFLGLFFIARGIFYILSWLSPVLLIATLIIDHRVITGYLKWMGGLYRDNLLMALAMTLLTIVGFPVVVGFLFGKALLKRKIRKATEEYEEAQKGRFIEYEEVDSRVHEPLELPEKKPEPKEQNRYERFFDEDGQA